MELSRYVLSHKLDIGTVFFFLVFSSHCFFVG